MVTIAEMTLEELKNFVERAIDARLTQLLGSFEIEDELDSDESWDNIRADVRRHRWSPPVDVKSSLELLREDRDR